MTQSGISAVCSAQCQAHNWITGYVKKHENALTLKNNSN